MPKIGLSRQVAMGRLLVVIVMAAAVGVSEAQSGGAASSSAQSEASSSASSGASSNSNSLYSQLSGGGSYGSSTGSGSSSSLENQLKQMFQFGMSPVSSTVKYFAPNTYQGAQTDLNNGLYTLSNGVSSVVGGYQSWQGDMMSRLSGQLQTQQELLVRLYQLVANPEKMCQQLASNSKSLADQLGGQTQQAASSSVDTSNSFLHRFGFSPFG